MTVFIPGKLANPQASEWKGSHWAKRARLAKSIREKTGAYILATMGRRLDAAPWAPKRVEFNAYVANPFDSDNLATACKPYRDALRDMKLIDDDRDSCGHQFVYRQTVARGLDARRGLEITVTLLEETP